MSETPEGCYFTFGPDHLNGKGANRYVFVPGNLETSRWKMLERFGNAWAFQYTRADDETDAHGVTRRGAGVKKYGLVEIDFVTGMDKRPKPTMLVEHVESGWFWESCEMCPTGHTTPDRTRPGVEPLYRRTFRQS